MQKRLWKSNRITLFFWDLIKSPFLWSYFFEPFRVHSIDAWRSLLTFDSRNQCNYNHVISSPRKFPRIFSSFPIFFFSFFPLIFFAFYFACEILVKYGFAKKITNLLNNIDLHSHLRNWNRFLINSINRTRYRWGIRQLGFFLERKNCLLFIA